MTRPGDFRSAMRRGRRVATSWGVIHVATSDASEPRFGFIVSKAVGSAVTRNLVKRRLRAAAHEVLSAVPAGTDIVIRVLPGSDTVSWATLQSELAAGVARDARRG